MKTLVALQDLIKQEEKRISLAKQQLAAHESGENKLSILAKVSTENSLATSTESLARHQKMLDALMQKDLAQLEEQERLKEAVRRKNYFHFQKLRLKRDKVRNNDQKLEAMMIIDELPEGIEFEDDELFELADKVIELELSIHKQLQDRLSSIKNDFSMLIGGLDEEKIGDLGMLNYQIPIIILHVSVLLENIKENIEQEELPEFAGFPKYEDWWIDELWSSHQAYFALYKWKDIIKSQCNTTDQKRSWEVIFSNWLFIKKMINGKGTLAYEYNYAFDSLMVKYGELEEELILSNLESMEEIIKKITEQEDFTTFKKGHAITTSYLDFKREKEKIKKE